MFSTNHLVAKSLSRAWNWNLDRAVIIRLISTNPAAETSIEDLNLKPWTEIPGPSSLPIVGQLHHLILNGKLSEPKYFQERLLKMYGPIVRLDAVLGREPHIFLFDAEATAHVLRSENLMPIRPGFSSLVYYRKQRNEALGKPTQSTGLITDHGENWRTFRSTVNPVMMQPKAIKTYAPVIEQVADDMVQRMKTNRDPNNKLKGRFDVEINMWSLESIAVVALGCRLNCLTKDLKEDSPEKRLIQCVHDLFHVSTDLDFKPSLWRYFPTKKFKQAMLLYEEQESLARYFINKSLKSNRAESNDDEKSIMEKLYEIDEEVALTMACDMLFAGVDTVAMAMTAILYLLAKNPEKQEKLREELSKSDTKYLRACIKEGMRILPVTAGNLRQLTKDASILGYKLPKGMNVVLNHQSLQRMETQFPQPLAFLPERWLTKDGALSYTIAHPFSYSPFGYGVRMCIGRRIAELEMEIFLSKVVQNFHIDWLTRPIPDLDIEPASLNYIKGPFDFVFKEVQASGSLLGE